MIVFDEGQFEIAVTTYKRPDYIQNWLERCYQPSTERNIAISVYDSSPDDRTLMVVEHFNKHKEKKVLYYHVSPETIIGYKPMIPIFESQAEYLWVSGDSRCHRFDELDEKVFPYIKNRIVDYIVINTGNNYSLDAKIYENKGEMLHDTFIASTCIGLSIYRIALFNEFKLNSPLLNKCDDLFKSNFGFGWLGYFYHAYSKDNYTTLLTNVKILPVLDRKKKPSWVVRFYGCWVEDLCQIIDNIPECYHGKEDIPRNTWKVMGLDSYYYGYLARKRGDLNARKFKQLLSSGLLKRISSNPRKIRFYATAPLFVLEIGYLFYMIICFCLSILRKESNVIGGGK